MEAVHAWWPRIDVTIRVEVTNDVTLYLAPIANVPSLTAGTICSSLILWSQPTYDDLASGLHHYMQVFELVVLPLCSAPTTTIENPPMYCFVMIHLRPSKSAVDHAKRLSY